MSGGGAAPLLTPEQYMGVLLQRQAAYEAEHTPRVAWVRPLLEWFIRDGDGALIDMSAIDEANARTTGDPAPKKPRTYRTAASLTEERDRLAAKRDALAGVKRHETDDPAAYGGIGIRQTPRQRAQYGARLDRSISEFVRLDAKVRELDARISRAKAREAE